MKGNRGEYFSEILLSDEIVSDEFHYSIKKKSIMALSNFNLITKTNDTYKLNSFGRIWKEKCSLLKFLEKNQDYFFNHDLEDIPEHFLNKIEQISNSELLTGIWPNFTTWKRIATESSRFLYCILSQPPFLLADIIDEKLSNGIELRLVFGNNSDIPEHNDLVEKLELTKIRTQERFKRRIVQNVGINIIMSEKEASLMFSETGTMDMSNSFVSSDYNFLDWCLQFFQFKWNQGEDFSRLRKIVS